MAYEPEIYKHNNDFSKTRMTLLEAAEVEEMNQKLIKYEQDYRAVATEFRVPLPVPGTDEAKLMLDARKARNRASKLETENLKLLAEIDEWKNASGLSCGGDPDAVTPKAAREYWENFEKINTSPVLYWTHVPMGQGDDGWDLIECKPDHPQQPLLHVVRFEDKAQVLITCRERDGDEEQTIADIIVFCRDDLADCSVCQGKGLVVSGGDNEESCPWCLGVGRSAMDEAREIACALYWSWLRSPNGGGAS